MDTTYKLNANQNKKGSQELIRIPSPWGKGTIVVGYIRGTTFYKRVNDKAILQTRPALCYDEGLLFQLQHKGVKELVVKHKTENTTWSIALDAFLDDAFAINRGRAKAQKCLCLNRWLLSGEPQKNTTTEKKSKKKQLQMKLGGM